MLKQANKRSLCGKSRRKTLIQKKPRTGFCAGPEKFCGLQNATDGIIFITKPESQRRAPAVNERAVGCPGIEFVDEKIGESTFWHAEGSTEKTRIRRTSIVLGSMAKALTC